MAPSNARRTALGSTPAKSPAKALRRSSRTAAQSAAHGQERQGDGQGLVSLSGSNAPNAIVVCDCGDSHCAIFVSRSTAYRHKLKVAQRKGLLINRLMPSLLGGGLAFDFGATVNTFQTDPAPAPSSAPANLSDEIDRIYQEAAVEGMELLPVATNIGINPNIPRREGFVHDNDDHAEHQEDFEESPAAGDLMSFEPDANAIGHVETEGIASERGLDNALSLVERGANARDANGVLNRLLLEAAGLVDGIVDPGPGVDIVIRLPDGEDDPEFVDPAIAAYRIPVADLLAQVAAPPGPETASSRESGDEQEDSEEELAMGGPRNELEELLHAQGALSPEQQEFARQIGNERLTHPLLPNTPMFDMIRAYKLQIEINLGSNSFQKLRVTYPEWNMPSLKVLRSTLANITGIRPQFFDMCQNVCICYTGPYKDNTECIYCHAPRIDPKTRKAHRQFEYLPLIPQIQSLYANAVTAKHMLWRSEHHLQHQNSDESVITDIYDSAHYQELLRTRVRVNDQPLHHNYFNNAQDVLLVMMTDGFQLFKRSKHSAWPLIFVNGNLSPRRRFGVNNLLCVGAIPGPQKPKDFDSFLSIAVQELEQAAYGVTTFDANTRSLCELHIYCPFGSGDMPAAALALTGGKQHSALHGCRTCNIEGVRTETSNNPVYYVPIRQDDGVSLRPLNYPALTYPTNRTHDAYLLQAELVDTARTVEEKDRLSVLYGVRGRPITARIPGVRFPWSFGFDFMHLMENMNSNYVTFIGSNFKDLGTGSEDYRIEDKIWKEIGELTSDANRTMPSAFGRKMPNIATEISFFTAEAYLVWWTMFAPVLLRGRIAEKYYWHLRRYISIINRCLAFKTTKTERDQLRQDIVKWYEEYETIFYQFKAERLPTCLQTVHAWLHIVDHIENTGPMWSYWCWVMERFCGRLSRAIASRKHPYSTLNRRLLELQTLFTVRNLYGLHKLLPDYTQMHNSRPRPTHSIPGMFPNMVLKGSCTQVSLSTKRVIKHHDGTTASPVLRDLIYQYLCINMQIKAHERRALRDMMPLSVRQYAKVVLGEHEEISTVQGSHRQEDNLRDATWIRWEQERADDTPITFYGQVHRAFVCTVGENPDLGIPAAFDLILLDVDHYRHRSDAWKIDVYGSETKAKPCVISGNMVKGMMGRIWDGKHWAFVALPGKAEFAGFTQESMEGQTI